MKDSIEYNHTIVVALNIYDMLQCYAYETTPLHLVDLFEKDFSIHFCAIKISGPYKY